MTGGRRKRGFFVLSRPAKEKPNGVWTVRLTAFEEAHALVCGDFKPVWPVAKMTAYLIFFVHLSRFNAGASTLKLSVMRT